MKVFLASIFVAYAMNANAAVVGSSLTEAQQNKIAESVAQICHISADLVQLSETRSVDRVDQGVEDVYITTTFQAQVRLDQMIFDTYLVKVNSVLASGYDHQNQQSGVFSVLNVTCHQN